jgi:hypothetical protein
MITLIQTVQPHDLKQEVREITALAKRLARSKTSARRFLVAAGIYNARGQFKRGFR